MDRKREHRTPPPLARLMGVGRQQQQAEPALLGDSRNQHLQLPVHGYQAYLWHITVTMLFLLYFMTSDADCMMNIDRTTAVQRRPDIYNLYTKRILTAVSEGSHP